MMNGAESLVRTLVKGGIDICFTNPGTSEMHFVAALDRVEGMRSVLCLFEGVAAAAADGFARMTERPASTLFHLGPGLGNAIANLHNAKKAMTPLVNIVGEHATQHLAFDAPLTADIEGLARPVSHWVRTGKSSRTIAAEGAAAIAAAQQAPGQVATLILPADTAWGDGGPVHTVPPVAPRRKVDEAEIRAAVAALQAPGALLFIGTGAARAQHLALAGRIAAKTGARLLGQTSIARQERGAGRVPLPRLPYPVDLGLATLKEVRRLVLCGASDPVAFFGYPGQPSRLAPPEADIIALAGPADDLLDALERVADALGVLSTPLDLKAPPPAEVPSGAITPERAGAVIGAVLPEGAIVVDESVTTGRGFALATAGAQPHDWLQLTGGSIGIGPPLALGAALACPDRKVVNLEADGSAMYTLQALWSQARSRANVLTVIWSNRAYQILRGELAAVGATNPGRKALDMLSLDNPTLDWVSLARGMGVDGRRVDTAEDLAHAMRDALKEPGPFLIEAVM